MGAASASALWPIFILVYASVIGIGIMAAYKKQDDYAARQQRRKPQKAHSADDPKSARSPDGRRRSGTLHQMLFTKQRACAQQADASHQADYHLGRINRKKIGRAQGRERV